MVAKDEVLARTPQRRLGITRGLRSCECIGRFAAQLVDRDHRHDDGDETECGDVDESARETLQRHARERERRAQSTCGGLRHRQMQDAPPCILTRLRARDRVQLVVIAYQAVLVSPQPDAF
jgi:hypothetical protein